MVPAPKETDGLTGSTCTSTSTVSVAVNDVPRKLIVAVFVVEVTTVVLTSEAVLKLPFHVAPVSLIVNVNVTPAGTLLNVNRICVLLSTPVLLFESCVLVRKADAKPSARTIDALGSTTFLFVKTEAVP